MFLGFRKHEMRRNPWSNKGDNHGKKENLFIQPNHAWGRTEICTGSI